MILNPISKGGNGLLPEIIVTAPSGTILDLIQNGVILQTYTLGSEEAKYTFVVKNIGTYTIRGTNGNNIKNIDIVIDTIGRYECTIQYKVYLYNNGDQCEDVTGGWLGFGGTTGGTTSNNPSFASTYISIPANYWGGGAIITSNKINRRGYTKIGINYNISGVVSYSGADINTCSEYTTKNTSYGLEISSTQDNVCEEYIIKDGSLVHGNSDSPLLIEITNQIDDIRVYITHGNNNGQTLKIYEIWFE